MIGNTTNQTIKIMWDGREHTIAPGQVVDLAHVLDIHTREVPFLETRFTCKYKGLVKVQPANVPSVSVPQTVKVEQPKQPVERPVKNEELQEEKPMVDPNKDLSFGDFSKSELIDMLKAQGIKKGWNAKSTKEELTALLQKHLSAGEIDTEVPNASE